jgi:GTP cyclohydrolase I
LSIVELPSRGEPQKRRDVTPAQWSEYERYMREIFTAFGMDVDTPGTRETPTRFLRAMFDATGGYDGDPKLRTAFPSERPKGVAGTHSQIVEGPISFFSLCEHHALPFHGAAYVTVQERLGEEIADTLIALVQPRGVAVRLEAAHLCTQMRGVEEEGSRTVTTFWRGLYDEDADLRREFLTQLR